MGAAPNNSFKPNLLRSTKAMASFFCHGFGGAKQVGLTQALDMPDSNPLLTKLESSLSDTSGVYVNAGVDAESYFAELASSIRSNVCEPFHVTATVMPPGFSDSAPGTVISGQCIAHRAGYWLVYQLEQDRFCCFWGESSSNLGAHGVFGSPLYCWSA